MLKATKKELVVVCKQLNIKGYSKLNKEQIVELINNSVPSRKNNKEEDKKMKYAPTKYIPIRTSKEMEEIFNKYGKGNSDKPVTNQQLNHLELLGQCFVEVPDNLKEKHKNTTRGEAYRLILGITKKIEQNKLTHYPVSETAQQVKLPSTRQLAELERLSKLTGIKVSEPESMKVASELITKLRRKEWQLKQIAASKAVAKEVAITEEPEKQSVFAKLLNWFRKKGTK